MQTYAHPLYAASLSEFGRPQRLRTAEGSILVRPVPGFDAEDAMGAYPMFSCSNWSGLRSDLEELDGHLVSLGVVADPHGDYPPDLLNECFDRVTEFKQHYVVDLERPLDGIGSLDRRKKARRALRKVDVEVCDNPAGFAEEWNGLYRVLTERHAISGIRAFSPRSFEQQLALPGVDVLKAVHAGKVVGALIMFWQGEVVCGHLCAVNELGYRLRATYALDWFSFEYYSGRARLIDLGGGLALGNGGGLADYKAGWATRTVPVHFCGRIMNHERYEEITAAKGIGETGYFPAYRMGEYA